MKVTNASWIPVFKAGRHVDASGNTRTFTEADLDTIIQKYKESGHEAPIVIGHPTTNAPAYGWVSDLKRVGKTLFAQVKDVAKEFSEWVEKGLYKKRSISLYPDLTLRHVGFLGAIPPAIKGLPDVSFSETGNISFEFQDQDLETRFGTLSQILRRLREWFIAQFGTETADELLPNYAVEEIGKPMTVEEETEEREFSERRKNMEELQKMRQELLEKERKLKEYEAREAQRQKEKKQQKIVDFAEKLIKDGKLLPKFKEDFITFATALDNSEKLEFSEGKTATQLEKFFEFAQNLPEQISFKEAYLKKKEISFSEDRDLLDEQIRNYAKEKNITYKEALQKILKEVFFFIYSVVNFAFSLS
ncbi:hypothetical protein [Thermospira aquatica]|uniref:Uncharacterized protein n=1 Tax=Thermospira aquatica TaxID=2828656 RepID=A0AAX3BE86_9SPIR|nr:hypothetical protein [Thermospira aquatica]URA10550.1 hypothetical protein KDW03_01740 [Thermospira aquatica]